MVRTKNEQISLKPQDLLVSLKVLLLGTRPFTYATLASELGMSVSQVHAAAKRSHIARLVSATIDGGIVPNLPALREFVIHGARYAFPATTGSLTRGMPTAFAGPPLENLISQAGQTVPVWPDPLGTIRGYALYPIYPTVPKAANIDRSLYEVLTLLDAIRIGAARERELAVDILEKRLR